MKNTLDIHDIPVIGGLPIPVKLRTELLPGGAASADLLDYDTSIRQTVETGQNPIGVTVYDTPFFETGGGQNCGLPDEQFWVMRDQRLDRYRVVGSRGLLRLAEAGAGGSPFGATTTMTVVKADGTLSTVAPTVEVLQHDLQAKELAWIQYLPEANKWVTVRSSPSPDVVVYKDALYATSTIPSTENLANATRDSSYITPGWLTSYTAGTGTWRLKPGRYRVAGTVEWTLSDVVAPTGTTVDAQARVKFGTGSPFTTGAVARAALMRTVGGDFVNLLGQSRAFTCDFVVGESDTTFDFFVEIDYQGSTTGTWDGIDAKVSRLTIERVNHIQAV